MTDSDRLARFLRTTLQNAGRQYEEARHAFTDARRAAAPEDESASASARIVCRRHAERRVVTVDSEGRPACFEAGHPDCEGCAEDVREGVVETW
jgi:hypothetical protein